MPDVGVQTVTTSTAVSLAIGVALAFFFGLAFEEAYASSSPNRPGGIRTFPLLAIAGFVLYSLEPTSGIIFVAGLAVLGLWLLAHYRSSLAADGGPQGTGAEIVIPLCNVLAYALGPIALVEPPWLVVGVAVAAVLLLNARDGLHALATRIPVTEITTLGKFLILTGVVLPLAPRTPVTDLTPITPHQVWLAVVVVSSLSYGSYLVQRFTPARRGVLVAAVLGGLYSSTATTVMLSRQSADASISHRELGGGVVLATAMMYLRVGAVVAIFDVKEALAIAPALAGLFLLAVGLSAACAGLGRRHAQASEPIAPQRNPLEIGAALLFATLFVVVSLLSQWVMQRFGHRGIYSLAAVVGITDIDPFLLSLVQGSVRTLGAASTSAAILFAASSNDVLKALYTVGFAGGRGTLPAVSSLLALAASGAALALWIIR